jgi:hypothetical protein
MPRSRRAGERNLKNENHGKVPNDGIFVVMLKAIPQIEDHEESGLDLSDQEREGIVLPEFALR